MKIVVKQKYARTRWFRDLTAAMRFAELSRQEQGGKIGSIEVHIYDGRSPHFLARYGIAGGLEGKGRYSWQWSYAKGF